MVSDTVKIIGIIIIAALVMGVIGIIAFYVGTFNSLNNKDIAIEKMKSDLDAQYQRRADLIPNLVATVQGSAQFEKSTQIGIAQMRSDANTAKENMGKASTPSEIDAANNEMTSVWSRLMVVVEAYPVLKSNENFKDLQSQLEGTENRITYARTEYNEVVQDYKQTVRNFPTSIVANMNNFREDKWEMFKAKTGADVVPVVTFNI
jgi:LemA protein